LTAARFRFSGSYPATRRFSSAGFSNPTSLASVAGPSLRALEAIYAYQKKNLSRTSTIAQKASDAVGKAIKRLHSHIAKATNADGTSNTILRAFADHIRQRILIPSGRNGAHGGFRPPHAYGGFFICQKPNDTERIV